MLNFIAFAGAANAASAFSNSLKGYDGDTYLNPAILDGSGLEPSRLPGADWHWELIAFDATGATYGINGNDANWRGRNTLNTVDGDYNTASFTATVTVDRTAANGTNFGSVFLGLGTAGRGWRDVPDREETDNAAIIFELEEFAVGGSSSAAWGTNVDAGYTEVNSAAMSTGTGLIQLKMDFDAVAQTAAFSIDYGADGTYEDIFAAFDVSAVLAEMVAGDAASIYFGTDNSATMSDFSVSVVGVPTRVFSITGSESPVIHSPGDVIRVTVSFSDTVTLSQAGDAKLQLDLGGIMVDAVHTGSLEGTSLTFQATAPSNTVMDAKVVSNSLQLLNGATLLGSDSEPVNLDHDEVALPNDQINNERLSVYPSVSGLDSSPHYSFRVHEVGSDEWMTPFAWLTYCKEGADNYKDWAIGGWSQTYCNFEMANNVPIEVEITKLDSATGLPVDIKTAVAHPRRRVKSWRVENGKAYVIFENPVLFAVDIDGALDETIAPRAVVSGTDEEKFPYRGTNAIHTVTIFANPFILDKPDLSDTNNVYAVEPGEIPPEDGSWTTLYFKPGVHRIFDGADYDWREFFRVHANKSYYIPGDAIVHGNMTNDRDDEDAQNIRIFGHGTLSGERVPHPDGGFGVDGTAGWPCSPVWIGGAQGCKVEGVTFADGAFHTVALAGSNTTDPAKFNYVRWAKTITWRDNGDGIQSRPGNYIEDCFMRCQDDGSYIDGMGLSRNVYWTDVNGGVLRCTFITARDHESIPGGYLYVEDIDIIYARSYNNDNVWHGVITLPSGADSKDGNTGSRVVFRNINVEDPLPGRKLFAWDSRDKVGDIAGVRFENVRAAAPHVFGAQDNILGTTNCHIRNLIFDNVTLAGKHYDSLDDFEHNEYVYDFNFVNTAPETMTYLNNSGYGKWYLNDDWDRGVEPADNDLVNHTAVADVLKVDAPAYAGSLIVAHADTAAVEVDIPFDGRFAISSSLVIGTNAAAPGKLELNRGLLSVGSFCQVAENSIVNLNGGSFQVEGDDSAALVMDNTALMQIAGGLLQWKGNRISDLDPLISSGVIRAVNGPTNMLSESWDASWTNGSNILFADYNDVSNGYTTLWAFDAEPPVSGYDAFSDQYALIEGSEGDDDQDGLSNLGEYALNGNPTNEDDTGLVEMQVDSSLFTFVHASNVVDSTLVYRLLDKTNLVSGITHTNNWDSQTIGLPGGDYAVVSNYYAVGEQEQRFIQLHVEQE